MTTRERLIELVCESEPMNECLMYCVNPPCYMAQNIADHLIANGVTFAKDTNVPTKWIPVEDRLPKKGKCVQMFFREHHTQAFGFWHDEHGEVRWCTYTDNGWYTDCDDKPTHWMPLPKPPKGVE